MLLQVDGSFLIAADVPALSAELAAFEKATSRPAVIRGISQAPQCVATGVTQKLR
jgi:hypothetical protein